MDKLANYGSDDDCEEESPKTNNSENEDRNVAAASTSIAPKPADTNYDNVGMELSEVRGNLFLQESDGSMRNRHRSKSSERRTARDGDRERRFRTSPKYSRSTRESDRGDDDQRRRRDREDRRDRDDRRDREDRREREERRDRDEDRRDRDRDEDRRTRGGKDREEERRDGKYRRDKYRDDRRWRRSNSREKYRNKSPTSKRSRRSSSREKKYPAAKRFDKAAKLASLEKMGIDLKVPEEVVEKIVPQQQQQQPATEHNHVMAESKFFIPGVTGRLREQMEKRKQLWQKKPAEPERKPSPNPAATATTTTYNSIASSGSGSKPGKVWETTIFAQDQDGKQASKFKRLMGIREPAGGNGSNGAKPTDMVKKQEELFHTMEQQYEVARTATHTMRGVGLGFGSYQR